MRCFYKCISSKHDTLYYIRMSQTMSLAANVPATVHQNLRQTQGPEIILYLVN